LLGDEPHPGARHRPLPGQGRAPVPLLTMPHRLVVTGATGRVGRALATHAEARGWAVTGLARTTPRPCDLTDRGAVRDAITAARPDLVVHCAALADVDTCERDPAEARRQNVDAATHVAEATAAVGAHLVHLSTDYVFGGDRRTPYDVDDATGPVQVYGRTKVDAEVAVAAIVATATVVRTSWV